MECFYSQSWNQRSPVTYEDDFGSGHVTAPYGTDARQEVDNKPLREKNNVKKNGGYKHVPHRDKPPQVVAKRNARERRRVQAVNSAFVRLRKAIPIQNTRSKRVSKVKTLQNAIEYIHALEEILQNDVNEPVRYGFENNYFGYKYDEFSNNCIYETNGSSRFLEN